jgi:hypothetical protein
MDGESEHVEEPRSEPISAGLAAPEELATDEVPNSLISDFSSLTTPYCWVITEDGVAGYDGAEPSAVGKFGPGQAVADDVAEALTAGRFFRLVDGAGRELVVGRLYDPSGENELAPLDDFGRRNLGALNIEFRAEGDWRAVLPGKPYRGSGVLRGQPLPGSRAAGKARGARVARAPRDPGSDDRAQNGSNWLELDSDCAGDTRLAGLQVAGVPL